MTLPRFAPSGVPPFIWLLIAVATVTELWPLWVGWVIVAYGVH
jgi:hypothetical protein